MSLNAGGRLGERGRAAASACVARSPQTLGLECGELMPWFQHGASPELPGDQRADDGKSICFDTAPLASTTEILGTPVATLVLSVDKPIAFVCVRLCDVAPDGDVYARHLRRSQSHASERRGKAGEARARAGATRCACRSSTPRTLS